jgi:N-acyl-D-aspartate/D-glutamate deacylase
MSSTEKVPFSADHYNRRRSERGVVEMLDVVIKGAQVADGTGRPKERVDVGVRDGVIVSVGKTDEPARRTIDADGLVLAPGFVDIHTHFDAQVFWDPYLTPSSLHGITSVIAGNCGFSVAPLVSSEAEYMMRMLARVEGMPLASLETGVPWNWSTTADYLDAIEGTVGVNVGFLVGHSALRRVVMGEDSVGKPATEEQIREMELLLGQSLAAGGMGLSSSWATTHCDGDGDPVPSRAASHEEIVSLCRVLRDHPGTTLEMIPTAYAMEEHLKRLLTDMSVAANRPVNWNVLVVDAQNPSLHEGRLDASNYAAREGGRVLALTTPDTIKFRLAFTSGFVLDSFPEWSYTLSLPEGERLRALADPDHRRKLEAGARKLIGTPRERLVDWGSMVVAETFSPETARYRGWTIGKVASDQGKDLFDAMLDLVIADRLRTSFAPPPVGDDDITWNLRRDIWRDERVILGASDAGAHVESIHTFNYPTALLGESVRERELLSVEEAIHLLTDVPARLYGLRGRGRIEPGYCADIVLFDETTVGPGEVVTKWDLPAGAPRLYSEPDGFQAIFVNGVEIARENEFTGDRPGTVLRSGVHTETVAVPAG